MASLIDTVAVLRAGGVEGSTAMDITLKCRIPPGHKMCIRDMKCGDTVVKDGYPIGVASRDIGAGEWAHRHNIEERTPTELKWRGASAALDAPISKPDFLTVFRGFRRKGTRPGTRNELWVFPASREIHGEVRRICSLYHAPYWIDAVRVFDPFEGSDTAQKIVSSLARVPNAAGVLFAGMHRDDCMDVIASMGCDGITSRLRIATVAAGCKDIHERLDELASDTPRVRELFPITDLRVGVMCASPSPVLDDAAAIVGELTDDLSASGAPVITADTLLFSRLRDVFASRIADRRVFERYEDASSDIYLHPLDEDDRMLASTQTEIALCAYRHTGRSLVSRVIAPGERSFGEPGVQAALAPSSIAARATALTAAGAQIIVMTTAAGTPFSAPIPTIKIVPDDITLAARDAWATASAQKLDARSLKELIIRIASGELTHQERASSWSADIFLS